MRTGFGLGLGFGQRRRGGGAVPGPTNAVAPAITGTAQVGQTLTCSTGTWTGTGSISYARQWLRNGANISGATSSTYTLQAADDLTTVSCRVTATDDLGARAASATGVAVTYAAPTFTVQPTLDAASYEIGDTVTLTEGTATPGTPVLTITTFALDGVSKIGELSGLAWDSTGEAAGEITYRVTATNSGGSTLSDLVTADLVPANPATAANFQSVNANGWSATYAGPPTFNPVTAPEAFTVYRSGYDATGTAVTVQEDVLCMARIRQPYPNQVSLTADQVALSDYIYAGDTIEGGAANNSTRARPKPIAMWLTHDWQIVQASSFTVRLAVAHAHARNGRPVAAVKFTATDGTNTVETLVSAMSAIAYANGSGLTVPHFAGTLDFSTLAPGATITIDAVIYPWVGAAFTISADADSYPSCNLTTLRALNDRLGGYGTAYAHVDATLGNNATAVVSTNPATAAAAPYLTIAAAAAGIKTFNNTNFARNNTSGGVIRLVEGVHTHANFSASTSGDVPLLIEAADAAKRLTTVWRDAGVSVNGGTPGKVKIRNLTLRQTANSVVFLDSATTGTNPTNMLVFEACHFDLNGMTDYDGWIWRPGRMWLIDCSSNGLTPSRVLSTASKQVISIGSGAGSLGDGMVHAAGCKSLGILSTKAATAGRPDPRGGFFGYNHAATATTGNIANLNANTGDRGAAFVGNVLERYELSGQPLVQIAADSSTLVVENVVFTGNTMVGERMNWLYDEGASTSLKSGYRKFNVYSRINTKSDVFKTNGAHVGNWSEIYKVGDGWNVWRFSDSAGNTAPGVGNWLGEIYGRGEAGGTDAAPFNVGFVVDASLSGSATGWGDYTPASGTSLPTIPAGFEPWSHDQKGNALGTSGTAYIGAIAG